MALCDLIEVAYSIRAHISPNNRPRYNWILINRPNFGVVETQRF